jgi:3-phenylpropionate/trans-cinnamate dioxygenase ferredoxin component
VTETISVRTAAPPRGGATRVVAGGVAVAVFDLDGELVAVDDRCLHQGSSLASGFVRSGTVMCPAHWWRYDLRTGERVGGPHLRLRRYPVERVGDEVVVQVPVSATGVVGQPSSVRERLLQHAREWRRAR